MRLLDEQQRVRLSCCSLANRAGAAVVAPPIGPRHGAVDGLEIPLGIVDQSKYYEVTKFLSLTGHIYSMIGCLISKRSFDRLPADLKTAVTEAAAEATPAQRAANAQATAGFRDSLQKHFIDLHAGQGSTPRRKAALSGMQINEVPDKAAFRRGVLPMYENFRGQIGADIIRDALAAVQ